MYDLGSVLDNATVGPATNLLVRGPPLTGKRRLVFEILAAGATAGEGSIVVTTQDSADRVLEDYRSVLDEPTTRVGVVDSVTRHQGRSAEDTETVKYASSPTDMTGIGIKLSGFLDEFRDEHGLDRNRVALDSLSALLMYTDLETVFRFMHAFTSRVTDAEGLGLYVIESTAHDAETLNTLEQLFDGVIEVDDDGVTASLPGTDASLAP